MIAWIQAARQITWDLGLMSRMIVISFNGMPAVGTALKISIEEKYIASSLR
jgi:hypothetical protein